MSRKIAMIFPGQGSQSIGMGRSFYNNSELARKMFKDAQERLDIDFKQLLFEENTNLSKTTYTQPAILLVSMIAYQLFRQRYNHVPVYFLGHSLGEFSALCASGAIDYLDALELVHKRGELMQNACSKVDATMMALVGIDDESVNKICLEARQNNKKIWPANFNQDGQVVIAGLREDLIAMIDKFKDAGAKRTILLDMSVASHCELLSDAKEPLENFMKQVIRDNFEAPIVSNVTTTPYNTKDKAIFLLKEQLTKPVKYKQLIKAIANEVDLFIEFGNKTVLKGLNRRIVKDIPTLNIFDFDSLDNVIQILQAK